VRIYIGTRKIVAILSGKYVRPEGREVGIRIATILRVPIYILLFTFDTICNLGWISNPWSKQFIRDTYRDETLFLNCPNITSPVWSTKLTWVSRRFLCMTSQLKEVEQELRTFMWNGLKLSLHTFCHINYSCKLLHLFGNILRWNLSHKRIWMCHLYRSPHKWHRFDMAWKNRVSDRHRYAKLRCYHFRAC